MPAHPYGVLVVVYGHGEDFFSPGDVVPARECLRVLLWEQPEQARQCTSRLSPVGQQQMTRLIKDDRQAILPLLLRETELHATEMQRVSPHGRLAGLRVPVLLLHGAGDNVIPPSETEWLAQEVPTHWLRTKLISPAISHVELDARSSDRFALVNWMAALLAEAAASPQGRIPPAW